MSLSNAYGHVDNVLLARLTVTGLLSTFCLFRKVRPYVNPKKSHFSLKKDIPLKKHDLCET